MSDYRFCFVDEAAMNTALASFFYQPDYGDAYLVTHTENYAFDIIGTIYKSLVAESGWYVNLRIMDDTWRDEAEALKATYGVYPTTPERVWL